MPDFALAQLRGRFGLHEVVDPGAAAADVGFLGDDEFHTGNALQERARLGAERGSNE